MRAAWPAWLAAAIALTAPTVAWHVAYFRSPGPGFFLAAVVGLPLLAVAAVGWSRLRQRRWWRYEPMLVAAPAVVLAVVREPVGLASAALIFAAAYSIGRLARERIGIAIEPVAAEIAVSSAAGFAVLHVVLFTLGMCGALYWWLLLPLLAAPMIFERSWLGVLKRLASAWTRVEGLRDSSTGLLIPYAVILALCCAAVALAPAIAFDPVKMHLPLAQYYVQQHALEAKPGLEYSFFPQSAEVVFAAAMAFGGQAAAQLIVPGFFILSLLALWAVVRECGATAGGAVWGVIFAAAMPFLHWSGSAVKNDLQLTLFQLAALYGILRWKNSGDFRWVAIAAMFAGASFGVKHPALFGGLPLGLLLLQAAWRQPKRVRALIVLLLIAASFCAMWYVRTAVVTGNPLYPLRPGEEANPDRVANPTIWDRVVRVATLPFTLPFGGLFYFESPSPTPIGIALVVFWPVWLVSGRPNRAERVCLFFGVLAFFWWGCLSPMVRYVEAPLAVLAALTGARAATLFEERRGLVRWATGFAAMWCTTQAICSFMQVEINGPQLRYLAGAIGREQYLSAAVIPYPAIAFVNRNTGPDDRILGIENCLDAYAPPAPRYLSECMVPWTAETIGRQLRRDRFTWIVAPVDRIAETVEALRGAGRTGEERYRDQAFVVFRLK